MTLLYKWAAVPILLLGQLPDALASTATPDPGPAQDKTLWETFGGNMRKTWRDSPGQDIYLPAITWHNRYFYDDEHLRRYNEKPWGLGYGISRLDERDNWHGLYAMAFKDSFDRWEPFAGYAWESQWRPLADNDFRLGAGFTLGVTARHNWHYYPVPAVLPLASLSYRHITFQGTYIPGTRNNGNVLFAWLRWRI